MAAFGLLINRLFIIPAWHGRSSDVHRRMFSGLPSVLRLKIPETKREVKIRASEYVLSKIKPYGNNIAQVDHETGRRLTFDEVREKSTALTQWLQAHNFGPGNVVGLMSKNCVDYIWILLGIWNSGAACYLIDAKYTQREVTHALKTAPVDGLVLHKGLFQTISSSKTAEIKCILEFGDGDGKTSKNAIPMDEVLAGHKKNEILNEIPAINYTREDLITPEWEQCTYVPDDVALILSSSGSTGLPKGVMITHDNIVHGLKYGEPLFERGDRSLGLLPAHHMYGLMIMLMSLTEGATLVPMAKFSLPLWMKLIKEFSVTRLQTVTSLLVTLIKSDAIDFHDLSSVRHVYAGAAPVSAESLEALKGRFHQPVSVHVLYGMTEMLHTIFRLDCEPKKHGVLGRVYRGAEVKIIDVKTKEALGPNSVGEMCVRGPMVMKGYVNNPLATAQTIDEDGWLRTGDMGYYDEDGYFYFVERIKSVIKYQGKQVSPSELEFVLISHPDIAEAAVFGIEHDVFGQVPRALVIPRDDVSITPQEIHDYMRDVVAPFKLLRGGLVFVSSLPKTSSGKIKRQELGSLKVDPVFYDQNLKAPT